MTNSTHYSEQSSSPHWIYKAGIGRWRLQTRTRRKLYSVRTAAYGSLKLCHLDFIMLRPQSSGCTKGLPDVPRWHYSDRQNFRRTPQKPETSTATNSNGWTEISVKKCALFQKQVKYLGDIVTADGISKDEEKYKLTEYYSKNFKFTAISLIIILTLFC